MTTTELIILLFAIDIAAHILFTVGIGLWLNKQAHAAVESAAEKMYAALLQRVPEPVRQMFGIESAEYAEEREKQTA